MDQTSLAVGVGQAGTQILQELLQRRNETLQHSDTTLVQTPAIAVDSESKPISVLQNQSRSNIDVRSLIFQDKGCGNQYFSGQSRFSEALGNLNSLSILEATIDALRCELEKFDVFHGFAIFHSLAGGTGSGFSYQILRHLSENYSKPVKISVPVLPEEIDTGPMQSYNTVLSLSRNLQFLDFALLFQAGQKNADICREVEPVLSRMFEFKEHLAPLDEFKILTAASVVCKRPIESFKILDTSLGKNFGKVWDASASSTSISNSSSSSSSTSCLFEEKYLKHDAKRDPFLFSSKTGVRNYYEKIRFKDSCLNLTERQLTVYRNSSQFVSKVEPILRSCKMKCRKRAYFHHFDGDMVAEVGEAIAQLDRVVAGYKAGF